MEFLEIAVGSDEILSRLDDDNKIDGAHSFLRGRELIHKPKYGTYRKPRSTD